MKMTRSIAAAAVAVLLALVGFGCAPKSGSIGEAKTLFIVGFAVPGEAVEKGIAPAFARAWAEAHNGEQVQFQYSWGGSSVQARNVLQGLEADIVYLSDWTDVQKLVEANLVKPGWDSIARGSVSKSLVVFRVEPGNPKNIHDWSDLEREDVKVLTPNPRTSGAARWNILARYGAALKGGGDKTAAEDALGKLYRNVVTLGESGRATTQDFERGVGDVAITYENEALLRRREGKAVEIVVPPSTIVIENPAAVVDANVDKHGNRAIAEGFIAFLRTPEAQKILLAYGFRSVDDALTAQQADTYPVVANAFDIAFLGGWPAAQKEFFENGALWDRVVRANRRNR